jgi:hypothetical protein
MPTDTRALLRAHDKHAASLRTPEAVAAPQAVHKERTTLKAALRADPAARAAKLAAINEPIPEARRLATLNALAADITAKHGCTVAEELPAAQMPAQIKADAAVKALQKGG